MPGPGPGPGRPAAQGGGGASFPAAAAAAAAAAESPEPAETGAAVLERGEGGAGGLRGQGAVAGSEHLQVHVPDLPANNISLIIIK